MQTVVFYGASDDLVEVEGIHGGDEFGAWQREDGKEPNAVFVVGGRIRVAAYYGLGRAAGWSFCVGQVDEEVPLPDWPIRIDQSPETPYSVRLTIEAPDEATLVRVQE